MRLTFVAHPSTSMCNVFEPLNVKKHLCLQHEAKIDAVFCVYRNVTTLTLHSLEYASIRLYARGALMVCGLTRHVRTQAGVLATLLADILWHLCMVMQQYWMLQRTASSRSDWKLLLVYASLRDWRTLTAATINFLHTCCSALLTMWLFSSLR